MRAGITTDGIGAGEGVRKMSNDEGMTKPEFSNAPCNQAFVI